MASFTTCLRTASHLGIQAGSCCMRMLQRPAKQAFQEGVLGAARAAIFRRPAAEGSTTSMVVWSVCSNRQLAGCRLPIK